MMDWRLRTTTLVLWMVIGLSAIGETNGDQRIVCYYTNWSVYRPGTAKYSPQNINPYLCTHLIYAFGGFTKDNTLKPFDKYQDIEKGGYAKFTGLKTYNKKLKTMLAIGGWNEGSSRFSPMVADSDRRRELVKNSVKFLRQNHFDGLDLDWEYPAFRDGGKSRDKNNYADFVQELREEFERESSKTGRPRLILSMAIPAGIEYLEKGYDLPKLNQYLDFFNLLSYDYHSAFEPAVNHHAPLYGLEEANEYNYDSELTIDYTINYLLNHDVTSEKIVLGIPTYGRSYTLYNDEATDIGAPADGPGEEGDATREKGYLAYYEICENIAKSDEWEVVQPNEKAMGPYAFRENQWVGYDDEHIVRVKAFYVREKQLGGIMFWSIDNDDFRGKCHGRPYPLIEAAKEALLSGNEKIPEKSKPSIPRKKTRPHLNHRTTDASIDRKYSAPRRPGSKPTRKRLSYNSRPTPKTAQPTPDPDEDPEETRNTLTRSRKTRPKTRLGTRRREQTRQVERPEEESSSHSNSLTTPEPPTTPDPGSDFKCEDEGFFSHPRDCKKYFWCLDSGPGGLGIVAHQFTCPSGLVFNKAADSCDYPRNVVCPKVKTSSGTSTTHKPITSRTPKRTTTAKSEPDEEEYEYDDDDEVNAAEERDEIPVVSSTAKPLLYKTISRSRPTTTTEATTTEGTTETSRGFKGDDGETEDTEDPRVLKELIDLIKKAGGIEQLEKQLHLQEKGSGIDTTEESLATPATISRSLYEKVLNRQATKLFGGASGKDTKPVVNSRSSFQNGPGRSQFEGLDEVPEVKNLRRVNKYVTIARQRSSTNEPPVDDDEEELTDEEIEEDNDDVASSDARAVSSLPEKETKRVTPNYVNIRRSRPTTPASGNDLFEKDAPEENTSTFSPRQQNRKSSVEEEPEDAPSSTQSTEHDSTPKSRYTNIHRFRSTTIASTDSQESSKSAEEIPVTSPTSLPELTTSDQVVSTPSPSPALTTETPKSSTESLNEATNPTISTTHQSATEPVQLSDNSVTEILTTFPAQSSPRTTPSPRTPTSAVSPPRPFGYPRRTRPTPSSSSTTTTTSTTEQTRVKVNLEIPDKPGLPTLKELIDTNYGITRSFDASVKSTQSYNINSLNNDIDNNKVPQIIDSDGLRVRVKILDDYGSGEIKINQFAVLSLPQGAINPNITNTVLKIEVINNSGEGQLTADEAVQDNRLSRRRRLEEQNVNIEASQSRGSRRRGTVRQQSTTPHWTNSRRRNVRRRGNSRITLLVDQNAQSTEVVSNTSSTTAMSLIEHIITTMKPTTLRGSLPVIHRSDEPVRGFFITKSLDDITRVTDKINLREFTTEDPSTIATEIISTTINQEDDEVKEWSNELDGGKSTTVIEDTTLKVIDTYLPTTFAPVETIYNQGIDEDLEVTTVNPEITTYHPLKTINDEELEIETEIYVNDAPLNEMETTAALSEEKPTRNSVSDTTIYDRRQKLNESNFATGESDEEYTTESYYEAMVFTTPRSFTTVENQINTESGEISTDFEETTPKIIDDEITMKTIETSFIDQVIDEIDKSKSTVILKIIPFTRKDEQNSSPILSLQSASTDEVKNEGIITNILEGTTKSQIIPLTPSEADESSSPTALNLQTSSSPRARTSPLIVSIASSSTISTTPMSIISSTTTSIPEMPLKRTRTDLPSRGRIRYQQPSSTTPAARERKPRPSSSIRRRPQAPNNLPNSSEFSESSEQSPTLSPQPPPSTLPSVLSSLTSRRQTISRGRGRQRNRPTSTTTEQSFPPTEVPAETSKSDKDNLNTGDSFKNSQTGSIKEDDQTIAESSHAGVFGEMGLLRHSGKFLRRPGSIVRPTTSKSYSIEYETADRRYSSKFTMPTTESNDQTDRAQDIAVSLIDASVLNAFETGKETSTYRGGQRHRIEEFRGITETPIMRTTTPRRRRRPTTDNQKAKVIPSRPRRPAIIDYDYYVDEEVRISVKPELKNKIYVTSTGRIGCLDQGTFAHPFSCKKFITCAMMVGGKVVPTEYSCPNKLSFDPVGGICNWSAGLGCKESL